MRVVVCGAGYAGLTVVRRLERRLPSDVEVLLLDQSEQHLVQHELHRVIRRPNLADVITIPLEDLCTRAEIRQVRITDVDTGERRVHLADEDSVDYDVAVVCLGSETAFYGLPGVEENALALKRLDHARAIREQALAAEGGSAVVGGAGLSGIQTAGELAALSDEQRLDLSVTLVEADDRIAPSFGETFADALRTELEQRGITIETGVAVESATATQVELADDRTLPADVFVWTGGIRGPAPMDGERTTVAGDLAYDERTFVVGDSAAVVGADDSEAPASAQTAVRQARVAARNVEHHVAALRDGRSIERQRYRTQEAGWVVSVGDGAVAQLGPVVVNGDPARLAKAGIGAGHLGSVGAVRRASTLVASEFGWPTPDCAAGSGTLERAFSSLPTDPGTPSQLGDPFSRLLDYADDQQDDRIDLTPLVDVAPTPRTLEIAEALGSVFDSVTSDPDADRALPEPTDERPDDSGGDHPDERPDDSGGDHPDDGDHSDDGDHPDDGDHSDDGDHPDDGD
jgi:NADH dehydrogenase